MDDQRPIRRRAKRGWRRHSDGTRAGKTAVIRYTDKSVRARWLEAEVVRLKRTGMTFQDITTHVREVCAGQKPPITPANVSLANYHISIMGVHSAFRRVMDGLKAKPQAEADDYRYLQNERCEEMYLAMQPGIRQGSPPHVSSAVKVLQHQADLHGLIDRGVGVASTAFAIQIVIGQEETDHGAERP